MSLPIVELVVGNLKEGVTTAHPSFKKIRDDVAIGGHTKQTYGVAAEDPRKLYWIIRTSSPPAETTCSVTADTRRSDYETITPKGFLAKWPSDVCDYAKEVGQIMTEEPVSYFLPRDASSRPFPKATTDARVTEIVRAW